MDCHDYVRVLEEERRKIRVFQRELPLCLELVTHTIEACKQQLSGTTTTTTEQSDCSSDRRPVLEEFIPINPCSDEPEPEPQHQSTNSGTDRTKSDWLRSVQLWNQNPDPPIHQDVGSGKEAVPEEVEQKGGAFKAPREEKSNGSPVVVKPPCSAPVTAASSSREEKERQRKQRRCWSPELHRRFLEALEQLGGSHAATPKQIRELMKVEGLSNDEVKSHLQKYRLHTRPSSGNVKQFVVVGGIWVPPPTTVSGQVTTANGVYAPPVAAARPQPTMVPRQQKQSGQERGSHSSEGVHSHSQSTSSTTASHVL